MSNVATHGKMLAVGCSDEEIAPFLAEYRGKVTVACINSPKSVTLSGDADAIEALANLLTTSTSLFNRELRVDTAFHSHHMLPVAQAYIDAMKNLPIRPHSGPVRMFSSVTGLEAHGKELDPAYWAKNMTSQVKFSQALEALIKGEDGEPTIDVVVEVGPHSVLKGPINDLLTEMGWKSRIAYISSLVRKVNDHEAMLKAAGDLFCLGYPVDFELVNGQEIVAAKRGTVTHHHGSVVSGLPKYAWDHSKRYWYESRLNRNHRFRQFPSHEILGARSPEDFDLRYRWRNHLKLKEVPWLEDHKVCIPVYRSYACQLTPRIRFKEVLYSQLLVMWPLRWKQLHSLRLSSSVPNPTS